MLYQKFESLIHVEDRQAYITEDIELKPVNDELRQLVIDLADHNFVAWPFRMSEAQKIESREVSAICKDLKEKIIALHGAGYLCVQVSKDFAYLLHIHMASDGDDTGFYRRYPNEDKLIMEPGQYIPFVPLTA